MAAKDALEAYGYVFDEDGRHRQYKPDGSRRSTQVWEQTEDGWLRFDPEGTDPEVPRAYMVSIAYQGVAGLDMRKQPQAFVWPWPDGEVERIYAAAVESESARMAEVLKRKAAEAKAAK